MEERRKKLEMTEILSGESVIMIVTLTDLEYWEEKQESTKA